MLVLSLTQSVCVVYLACAQGSLHSKAAAFKTKVEAMQTKRVSIAAKHEQSAPAVLIKDSPFSFPIVLQPSDAPSASASASESTPGSCEWFSASFHCFVVVVDLCNPADRCSFQFVAGAESKAAAVSTAEPSAFAASSPSKDTEKSKNKPKPKSKDKKAKPRLGVQSHDHDSFTFGVSGSEFDLPLEGDPAAAFSAFESFGDTESVMWQERMRLAMGFPSTDTGSATTAAAEAKTIASTTTTPETTAATATVATPAATSADAPAVSVSASSVSEASALASSLPFSFGVSAFDSGSAASTAPSAAPDFSAFD